jgi:hypothetical protein
MFPLLTRSWGTVQNPDVLLRGASCLTKEEAPNVGFSRRKIHPSKLPDIDTVIVVFALYVL